MPSPAFPSALFLQHDCITIWRTYNLIFQLSFPASLNGRSAGQMGPGKPPETAYLPGQCFLKRLYTEHTGKMANYELTLWPSG